MSDVPPLAGSLDASGARPRPQRFTHRAMNCEFAFYLYGAGPARTRGAAQVAFAEIDRLEQLLSRFIPHSEIAQLNAAAVGQVVRISPETAECLQVAARWYTETGGAIDIAFRSRRRWSSLPQGSESQARTADAAQPITPLVFDPAQHIIRVLVAGLDLDLGAVGKGYALDRAAAVLREYGVPAGLLHSGQSTILTFGEPPHGSVWRLNLRNPNQHEQSPGAVEFRDAAISGSGQLPHDQHIIDPRTGAPAATRAAWAIAPQAAEADALSTAFMLMPEAAVAALCGRCAGVSGILLDPNAAGLELLSFGPHPVTRHAPPGRAGG